MFANRTEFVSLISASKLDHFFLRTTGFCGYAKVLKCQGTVCISLFYCEYHNCKTLLKPNYLHKLWVENAIHLQPIREIELLTLFLMTK